MRVLPRPRLRRRSGGDGQQPEPATESMAEAPAAGTGAARPQTKTAAAPKAGAQTPTAPPTRPARPVGPNERIDGLRAWVAQVDRKLGVRTYIGAALTLLALAAAGVALFFALQAKQDSATKSELDSVRSQL